MQAYNNCCYSNSGMSVVDVGYAQSKYGMWYCCKRYSQIDLNGGDNFKPIFLPKQGGRNNDREMYRNIDEDERLLIMARRYWDEEDQLTEEQLHWVLKNEGYSERRNRQCDQ